MYDIHSHILPAVDDGPNTIEEAVKIVYTAEQAGFKAIVCTPHYIEDSYKSSVENNLDILNSLKKAVEQDGLRMKLYLGNEVYITPSIMSLLDANRISTLNKSRYILIEMPVYNKPLFTDDIIFKLKLRGLVPVIVHPERYEWAIRNPKELRELINKGCLTQLNIASIGGSYGKAVRKAAKALIAENYIHLFGSDCHFSKKIYNKYNADLKLLKRISSERTVSHIIYNAEAIINDELIKTY